MEKAVYRIEQEIKRSKTNGSQSEEDRNAHHLQNLLSEAQSLLPSSSHGDYGHFQGHASEPRSYQPLHDRPPFLHQQSGLEPNNHSGDQSSEDQFPVDDAENPLQLLARASDLSVPTNTLEYLPGANYPQSDEPSPVHSTPRGTGMNVERAEDPIRTFFGPFRPGLDVGSEIDPVEMGLVSEEEAEMLFK